MDIQAFAHGVLNEWNACFGKNIAMETLKSKTQHYLTEIVHKDTVERLEQQDGPLFRTIVKAASMADSALWTDALQIPGYRSPRRAYQGQNRRILSYK